MSDRYSGDHNDPGLEPIKAGPTLLTSSNVPFDRRYYYNSPTLIIVVV